MYRILLGFPTSFALVAGLRALWQKAALRDGAPGALRWDLVAVSLVILAFAAPPTYPWNGRLFLQVHRPHPDLEMSGVRWMVTPASRADGREEAASPP